MLIGVDAHSLEGKRTGVGRYLFNLLKEWSALCHPERSEGSPAYAGPDKPGDSSAYSLRMTNNSKFILYFKDKIPPDLPESDLFEYKLLKVGSTAKFMHWDLPRAAKKDKIDILFCPGYIAPIVYSGEIILVQHDIVYEAHPEWFDWPSAADKILLKWVAKKSARRAKIILTPSEFSRQEVTKYYGAPPAKVACIPLAVDPALAGPTEKSGGVMEKYGIKGKFIFFVGSIFSRRHLPEILEAFGRLANDRPAENWQLVVSGADCTPSRAVDGLINKMNAKLARKAVFHIDFLTTKELKLMYGSCAFFIWLSDYEGFGLPPLEAMQNGAAVITSGGSSLKEVAGNAALLVKNNFDVDEIYGAMKRLTQDGNLRSELGAKGMEQAEKFSWKKCAEETLRVIFNQIEKDKNNDKRF